MRNHIFKPLALIFLTSMGVFSSTNVTATQFGFDFSKDVQKVYDSLESVDIKSLKQQAVVQKDSYFKKCLTTAQIQKLKKLGYKIPDNYCFTLSVLKTPDTDAFLQSEFLMRFAKTSTFLKSYNNFPTITDKDISDTVDIFINDIKKVYSEDYDKPKKEYKLQLNFLATEQAMALPIQKTRGVYFLEDTFVNYKNERSCITGFHIINAPYYKYVQKVFHFGVDYQLKNIEYNEFFESFLESSKNGNIPTDRKGTEENLKYKQLLISKEVDKYNLFKHGFDYKSVAQLVMPDLKYVRISSTFGFDNNGLLLIVRPYTELLETCNYKIVSIPYSSIDSYLSDFGKEYFSNLEQEFTFQENDKKTPWYWYSPSLTKSFYAGRYLKPKQVPVLFNQRYY